MSHQRELYELLNRRRRERRSQTGARPLGDVPADEAETVVAADQAPAASTPAASPAPEARPAPVADAPASSAEPRRRTDLVVSIEAALACFLAVAVMLCTAFWLGYNQGRRDLVTRLREEAARPPQPPAGAEPLPTGVGETRRAPTLAADDWVLRLISFDTTSRGLAQARAARDYIGRQEVLGEVELDAYILARDEAYTVCVGPSRNRHDPAFERLQAVCRRLPGPPTLTGQGETPFAGLSIERVEKLGRVVD